mmetsp:Transcript_47234/g.151603  ORF Transcript_47234/g.151603 Transcript_47234/m.151603 type:complete len:218 (+) Transcript_47234:783-1436(+)
MHPSRAHQTLARGPWGGRARQNQRARAASHRPTYRPRRHRPNGASTRPRRPSERLPRWRQCAPEAADPLARRQDRRAEGLGRGARRRAPPRAARRGSRRGSRRPAGRRCRRGEASIGRAKAPTWKPRAAPPTIAPGPAPVPPHPPPSRGERPSPPREPPPAGDGAPAGPTAQAPVVRSTLPEAARGAHAPPAEATSGPSPQASTRRCGPGRREPPSS